MTLISRRTTWRCDANTIDMVGIMTSPPHPIYVQVMKYPCGVEGLVKRRYSLNRQMSASLRITIMKWTCLTVPTCFTGVRRHRSTPLYWYHGDKMLYTGAWPGYFWHINFSRGCFLRHCTIELHVAIQLV